MLDGAEEETMELFGESGKAGMVGLMVVDMMNDVVVARIVDEEKISRFRSC